MTSYTFLNFLFDLYQIGFMIYNHKYLEAKYKFFDLRIVCNNYFHYTLMNYINHKYNTGVYRIHNHDYNNNFYIALPDNVPYKNLKLGDQPNIRFDFYLNIFKMFWLDFFKFIQLNPIYCLVLYIIYYQFPGIFFLLQLGVVIYSIYNIFDK